MFASVLAIGGAVALYRMPSSTAVQSPEGMPDVSDVLSLISGLPDDGFHPPSPTWQLELPADHGSHEDARMESWQVVAHLSAPDAEDIGFQMSLLRLGVIPPSAPEPESVWAARDIYRGYVSLVSSRQNLSSGEERFSRSLPGLAGFSQESSQLRLDDWVLGFDGDGGTRTIKLRATLKNSVQISLKLKPAKPVIALEPGGADTPVAGYAMTRLAVTGTLEREHGVKNVEGTAWLDHNWGELPLPGAGPVAWDRVQFHLSDGTDGTVLRARRTDGRGLASVNGVLVGPQGSSTALDDANTQIRIARLWTHEPSGSEYPVDWRIMGPDLDITVTPLFDAQRQAFAIPMWNGAVHVRGTHKGISVSGMGTLQLTGYEQG